MRKLFLLEDDLILISGLTFAFKKQGFALDTVTLYYDPDDPEKMYVEGDRATLGAEVLYTVLGVALLVLTVGIAR